MGYYYYYYNARVPSFYSTMTRSSNTQLICLRSNRQTNHQLTERKLSAMSLLSSSRKVRLPMRGIIFGVLACLLVQGAMASFERRQNDQFQRRQNDQFQPDQGVRRPDSRLPLRAGEYICGECINKIRLDLPLDTVLNHYRRYPAYDQVEAALKSLGRARELSWGEWGKVKLGWSDPRIKWPDPQIC